MPKMVSELPFFVLGDHVPREMSEHGRREERGWKEKEKKEEEAGALRPP